jgi:hypothetical protein
VTTKAASRYSREERWRRLRSLRLKSWVISILWPFVVIIVFIISEVGSYSLLQLVPGLNRRDAAVYGLAAQIATAMAFVAAGIYVIFSPRNDVWIRSCGRRGLWGLARQPMPKAKFHARYCAARNRGTAAIFLGSSMLEVLYAWGNLSKPLPSERPSIFLIAGILLSMAVLVNLFLSLTCLRERLALGLGAAGFTLPLVVSAAPAAAVAYSPAVRELALLFWASAALASLSLLKSALRAPPPDFRRS